MSGGIGSFMHAARIARGKFHAASATTMARRTPNATQIVIRYKRDGGSDNLAAAGDGGGNDNNNDDDNRVPLIFAVAVMRQYTIIYYIRYGIIGAFMRVFQ